MLFLLHPLILPSCTFLVARACAAVIAGLTCTSRPLRQHSHKFPSPKKITIVQDEVHIRRGDHTSTVSCPSGHTSGHEKSTTRSVLTPSCLATILSKMPRLSRFGMFALKEKTRGHRQKCCLPQKRQEDIVQSASPATKKAPRVRF